MGVILKGKHVVISDTLQKQSLEELHINYMGIEKNIILLDTNQYIGQVLTAILKNA